ncbi:MAG TPA: hypothetical protein ENF95_01400 [Candidatus Aenigmarchaeota archaeon]|nr:hypothetical protein [Candidatus Aenigmarchaeota archaeon]
MSVIQQTVSRILFPFLLLYSIYIITHGHLTPGGGFQGGVLLASSIILVCVVYGLRKAEHIIREETSHRVEAAAGIILAFLVVFELFIRKSLIATETLFKVWSGGEIAILNITGGVMVMTAFLLIFYSMVKES